MMKSLIVNNADAVSCTEPDFVIDHSDAHDTEKRRDIDIFLLIRTKSRITVVERGFSCTEVDLFWILWIRIDAGDILNARLGMIGKINRFSILKRKEVVLITETVNQAVAPQTDLFHINTIDPGIMQTMQIEIFIDHYDACRCSDIDIPLVIFFDCADLR